jgi:hypothetical protein
MTEARNAITYGLVSPRGHILVSSLREKRRDVIRFADQFCYGWSYERAKKDGWRITRLEVRALNKDRSND